MYLSTISSSLFLYDTSSWDLKKSYCCYDGIMRDISWSDDSKYLIQVNGKGLVEILTAADHDIRSLQHIPLKDTWSASFHREGHRNIAIGTKSGNVLIWDTKNKSIVKIFPTPQLQSSVNHICYNSKNSSLAACMQNGDTTIYSLVSNIPVFTVKLPCSKNISLIKFHHESASMLGLSTEEGHIVLRDISMNKDKCVFENAHSAPISDFAYSLINKDVMLSCGYDKLMHVYDVRMQSVVSTLQMSSILTSLAINTENHLALGTKSGNVFVYDLRTLTSPLKVLEGHDEEITKVAFQPVRKKFYSTEISLKEASGVTSPANVTTPVKYQRTSELLSNMDTPEALSINTSTKDIKNDSFLFTMGLDKSNSLLEREPNVFGAIGETSDKYYEGGDDLQPRIDVYNSSTPNNNLKTEYFNVSSTSAVGTINGVPLNGRNSNEDMNIPSTCECATVDTKALEELKDFIKLNIADSAYDNRNYFLHIMMMLTKEKLYLQKQLNVINEQMNNLVHNQNRLIECNQKLVLEIDKLKSQNHLN